MANKDTDLFQAHVLKYRKGDLLIKEGDYGASIYKVLKGKVLIFTESDGIEIPMATLGEGEIIGEMLFLKKTADRRSASARVIEESEIEIWHPSMLSKEYEEMPPVIKYIANQVLSRLVRMNKMMVQLTSTMQKQRAVINADEWEKKRRFYRKKLEISFTGRQMNVPHKKVLSGYITDISLGGVGMEITNTRMNQNTFKSGDEFFIKCDLPNGKELEFHAKLVTIKDGKSPGMPFFGMSFTEIPDAYRKDLGFFLMP